MTQQEKEFLYKFPCKIGDSVFAIENNPCRGCKIADKKIISEIKIKKIVIYDDYYEVSSTFATFSTYSLELSSKNFNNTWFLTKKEAEKKLKELEV